jgi:hypothetical protein
MKRQIENYSFKELCELIRDGQLMNEIMYANGFEVVIKEIKGSWSSEQGIERIIFCHRDNEDFTYLVDNSYDLKNGSKIKECPTFKNNSMEISDLMPLIGHACNNMEVEKGCTNKDLAISMPDWYLDLMLLKLKEDLGIEITRKETATLFGIPVVPNYEDKIIVFDKDYKRSGIEPVKFVIEN